MAVLGAGEGFVGTAVGLGLGVATAVGLGVGLLVGAETEVLALGSVNVLAGLGVVLFFKPGKALASDLLLNIVAP
jgi:hypothetical protein